MVRPVSCPDRVGRGVLAVFRRPSGVAPAPRPGCEPRRTFGVAPASCPGCARCPSSSPRWRPPGTKRSVLVWRSIPAFRRRDGLVLCGGPAWHPGVLQRPGVALRGGPVWRGVPAWRRVPAAPWRRPGVVESRRPSGGSPPAVLWRGVPTILWGGVPAALWRRPSGFLRCASCVR